MKSKALEAYAESKGWRFVRRGSRASHVILSHPAYSYKISIPDHGPKDLATGLVRTLIKQIDGTWRTGP
jgi:predicted RNA binding protein YcfA (HicA-like mRNA interferase family)